MAASSISRVSMRIHISKRFLSLTVREFNLLRAKTKNLIEESFSTYYACLILFLSATRAR
jgi:hypothetical protein